MVREHRRRRRDGVFGQLLLARRSRRSLRQASARAEAAGEFPARGGGAGGAEDEKELDGTAARETSSNDRLSGSCRGGAATAGASGASRLAAATATAGAASARAAAPATSRASSDRAAAIATAGASSGRAAETASTSS